jgi:hypothetical protein
MRGIQRASHASAHDRQPPWASFVVLGTTNENAGSVPAPRSPASAPEVVVPSGSCRFRQAALRSVKYGAAVCLGTYKPSGVFCRLQLEGIDSA